MKLKRQLTKEDLAYKGFPFGCNNCGNRPTAKQVIEHNGDCEICGDTVSAYTLDTAELLIKLSEFHEELLQGL